MQFISNAVNTDRNARIEIIKISFLFAVILNGLIALLLMFTQHRLTIQDFIIGFFSSVACPFLLRVNFKSNIKICYLRLSLKLLLLGMFSKGLAFMIYTFVTVGLIESIPNWDKDSLKVPEGFLGVLVTAVLLLVCLPLVLFVGSVCAGLISATPQHFLAFLLTAILMEGYQNYLSPKKIF